MTTYNTGNNLGSTDPRDLYDNAENLDNLTNGKNAAYDDRLGNSRKSWSGIEQDFDDFLAASGYELLGDYAAGIEVTAYNQIIREAGEFWRAAAGTTLPYTTTGVGMPEGTAFVSVGDANLRQELAANTTAQGSDLLAHTGTTDTVTQALDKRTIYVGSVAELEALSLTVGTNVYLTEDGRAGEFVVKSGTPPSDPQKGIYIVLANGNYAERQYSGAVSVLWYGAKGDDTTDDTTAIQAALDSGHNVYVPKKNTYVTSAPLVLDYEQTLFGDHPTRASIGSEINNKTAGECVIFSDTKTLYDAGIHDIRLSSAGHCINIKMGAVRCKFKQLNLYARGVDSSCVFAKFTSSGAMHSNEFHGGEYVVNNTPRTRSIIHLEAENTLINENIFNNLWITQSNGIQAITLKTSTFGVFLINNEFSNLNFEICSGGLFFLQGTYNTLIESISAWDTPGGYDNNLIHVSDNTVVYENRGLAIKNFTRVGDDLNGAAVDVYLGESYDAVYVNNNGLSIAGAIIDANNARLVIVGEYTAELRNTLQTSIVRGQLVNSPSLRTDEIQGRESTPIKVLNDLNMEGSGVSGNIVSKSFDSPSEAGTFTISFPATGQVLGMFDVVVQGIFSISNRSGYAAYRVIFNVGDSSVLIQTLQAPTNVGGGTFTTGFAFDVTKPNTNTVNIEVTKPSGSPYTCIVNGGFNRNTIVSTSFI